jgi:hypothetical protein
LAEVRRLPEQIGLADALGGYSLRLRISVDKLWVTPAQPE